jgi:hypothetical protein
VILSIMRQDQGLASQIKIISPPNRRFQGQPRPDEILESETVLIFPSSAVKTERLAELPEPYKLNRATDADDPPQSRDTTQPSLPRAAISRDVTQSPRKQPSVGSWQDSTPLPPTARTVTQPRELDETPESPPEATTPPKRSSGVRGAPRGATAPQDQIARDTDMVLAPPAEDSTPLERDLPSASVIQDDTPLLELPEPPRLNATSKRRPIPVADDAKADDTLLSELDLNTANGAANKSESYWSIWPPILTAGIGLFVLIGFSLLLRRRTQTAPAIAQQQSIADTRPPAAVALKTASRDQLDEIIDNQLPLTEEQVPLAPTMQFHGRPQPPKSIRMDQGHSVPMPHTSLIAPATIRGQGQSHGSGVRGQEPEVPPHLTARVEPTRTPSPSLAAATATQQFRIDRSGVTGSATETKTRPAATVTSVAMPSQSLPPSGPLDRALFSVQKQTTSIQTVLKREEHDA